MEKELFTLLPKYGGFQHAFMRNDVLEDIIVILKREHTTSPHNTAITSIIVCKSEERLYLLINCGLQ